MVVRFKPRFWKDIIKLKNDAEVITATGKVITQVEKAENISQIDNLKKLIRYETRFRIKVFLDKKRSYRMGLYIKGNTVWFARMLHRSKIYEENW